MNKVLNILVEGPTEKDFVTNLIYPFLQSKEINNVRVITIETSPGFKGGDVRYLARYKPNILKLLKGKEDSVVTSLIDFYRLRSDFPGYQESGHFSVDQRITYIEMHVEKILEIESLFRTSNCMNLRGCCFPI